MTYIAKPKLHHPTLAKIWGPLIGPVVLSLVLSAIRIYRLDVLRVAIASTASGTVAVEDRSTTESAA